MYLAPLSRIRRLSNIDIECLTRIFKEDGWGRGIYYFHANIINIIHYLQMFAILHSTSHIGSSIHPCLCGGAGGNLCAGLAVAFAAGFAAAFAPDDSESRHDRIHQNGHDDSVSCKQDLFLAVGHINWPAAMTI